MPTLTRPAPAVKVNRKPRTVHPAHGTVRVTVHINGVLYSARPLPIDPGIGSRAWRLRKSADGSVYDVARLGDGTVSCDCPSFEFDHKQRDNGPCKHGAALA